VSWQAVAQSKEDSVVEIVSEDVESNVTDKIVVDVSGAVEKAGVYEFSATSRINDALVLAGGLSASADRNWVSRFINLASKLEDGMKIYIPFAGEQVTNQTTPIGDNNVAGVSSTNIAGSTNGIGINSASISQLDTLWGIGEVRANQIISNRPYSSLEQLMTKAGIPKNVFERIKDQISLH
jgi:competence protein ComEA